MSARACITYCCPDFCRTEKTEQIKRHNAECRSGKEITERTTFVKNAEHTPKSPPSIFSEHVLRTDSVSGILSENAYRMYGQNISLKDHAESTTGNYRMYTSKGLAEQMSKQLYLHSSPFTSSLYKYQSTPTTMGDEKKAKSKILPKSLYLIAV